MYITSEGIILKQTKTLGGRRMISLFSKNYGKISCGTSINEGGKNKTALALRPFTYGRYELFKGREIYNIQGAETIKSYYALGEDIDKYMAASYVLELTDAVLQEGEAFPALFEHLRDFFDIIETRKSEFNTLVIAYRIKLLSLMGLKASDGLISQGALKEDIDTDIIETLRFIEKRKLTELEKLALKSDLENRLKTLLDDYYSYHLGIGKLKSEGMII